LILFINACMRGAEISRTYKLCLDFLNGRENTVIDLSKASPSYYTAEAIIERDRIIDSGNLSLLQDAQKFAAAEEILIGAPYWDLSFPAALKCYIEHICVRNVTFKATPTGTVGLCRAKRLTYITTAGGYIGENDHGTEYFRGLCKFFNIPEFQSFRAEGLDIEDNDTEAIMEQTTKKILGGNFKC